MGHIRRLLGRVTLGLLGLLAVFLVGTIGYHLIEGWGWGEAAYVTLLIVSTLGFGKLAPATGAGQFLTSVLIITGVGTLFYLLSNVAETIIETSLGLTRTRRMEREIAQLQDHLIVCGYGRVGRHAAEELAAQDRPFVIVDTDPDIVESARVNGCAAIQGDATQDRTLHMAGIKRASGLLITTASDAANVFITLTARIYNEDLIIVARANEDGSEAKLTKAGADKVIAPAIMGGHRMAALVLRPKAAEVMDTLLGAGDQDNWLEQTTINEQSVLLGRSLGQSQLEQQTGIKVIAIRRGDGTVVANPSDDEVLMQGDVLVSIGERPQLDQLEALLQPQNGQTGPVSLR